MTSKTHLKVVQGYNGLAVYVNDNLVAGTKPFGGGRTLAQWTIDEKVLKAALKTTTGKARK